MNSDATDSYRTHYETLHHIAEQMRQQQTPDIDQLVTLVEQATTAYKQCQARIDAVEKALKNIENQEPSEEA